MPLLFSEPNPEQRATTSAERAQGKEIASVGALTSQGIHSHSDRLCRHQGGDVFPLLNSGPSRPGSGC